MILDLIKEEIRPDENVITNGYDYNGIPVPRVTKILSSFSKDDGLMRWANYLGFKRIQYSKEIEKAAKVGTNTHSSIETILKTNTLETYGDNLTYDEKTMVRNCVEGFQMWWEYVSMHTVKIIGQEETLVCEYFGGTYDLLVEIDGRIYLVDFKTSNHITEKYFLQLAAYRYLLYTLKGINIDGVIVLQLFKDSIGFSEYILDFAIPEHYQFIEHCAKTFFSLVYTYFNYQLCMIQYDNIFGEEKV